MTEAVVIYTNTPTTGFSLTVPNDANSIALTPAGTLATGTITMPAAPIHGQIVSIASTQIVTALTHSANTGQVLIGALTALVANASGGRWVFHAPKGTWYPF